MKNKEEFEKIFNKQKKDIEKNRSNDLDKNMSKSRKGAFKEEIEKEDFFDERLLNESFRSDLKESFEEDFENDFEKSNELDPIVKKVQKEVEVLTERRLNSKLSDGIEILNKHNKKIKEKREERISKTNANLKKEYEKKEKQQVKIKPFFIFLILLFFITIIYVFFEYGPIFGISLNKETGVIEENKINITSSEEDIYEMYNEELLVYSNQNVSTYNSNGKKTWNHSLEQTFTPKIYTNSNYMAISNNSTGTIYLFENKNEILNKKIEGTINEIVLDSNGNFAVEYSTVGYKKNIAVYSKKGNLLYTIYLSNMAVIDIKLLENGKKMIIVQAETNSFKTGLKISLVDGNIVQTENTSNIKEIVKLDNNLLYDLTIEDENIIMLLDNKIIKCSINDGKIVEVKDFTSGQMLFLNLSKGYYSYIEKVLTNEKDSYKIENNKFDNTSISSSNLENLPKTMKNTGYINYFIYQDSLQVINKWGIELKNIKIDTSPKSIVVFNKEKSIALIYTNKIYIVNM